jgi:DNA polymerase-3 subunit epsilon
MQLQLSMAVADKLHEALLVRGEPLDVLEAARLLIAAPTCPPPLGDCVLETLVRNDHRFCLLEADGDCVTGSESGLRRISLRHWETPDPDLADVPFVALDLETTGARPGTAKITEIGAVRFEGLREVAQFNTLVNPMRSIPPMITQITGITQEMVADAPRIEEVIPELLEFLKGAVVVAHNACFDVGFLNYELRRLKGRQLGEGAFDTLPLARALAPGLPNYRLGTVAEALDAPVAACHRALADAQAAGHVFITLVGRMQEQGITRLSEARSFANPNARGSVEKLRLTRDIPRSPGAYHFLDKDGRILYVGKADRLRERVRSHFVANSNPARKVRQAIRLVEKIEWDETFTPLEAVVREQELILQHRPPCNLHGSRPENYTYLKLADSKMGLHLYTTTRGPRSPDTRPDGLVLRSRRPLLLGPFRGRSRLTGALELLQRTYPIRRCPQHTDGRPCVRAEAGRCLGPCAGDQAVRTQHDSLVAGLVEWLAGNTHATIPDPEERMDSLVRALSKQRRYEDAQEVRDAWDDLVSIRRSYASLVEARNLSFITLWPLEHEEDQAEARLNLVWRGKLLRQVSITRDNAGSEIGEVFAALAGMEDLSAQPGEATALVAVPQRELDMLLAVRRWFIEAPRPSTVALNGHGSAEDRLERWRDQALAHALSVL